MNTIKKLKLDQTFFKCAHFSGTTHIILKKKKNSK